MRHIKELDPERRIAVVEPGVVHDQLTNPTEARWNLTFGPDTSTHEYATFGGPGLVSYSASKHGLEGLTKTLAIDLAPNFQVNAIQPGWIATPMTAAVQTIPDMNAEVLRRTPMGRWGEPDDHAGAAVFLASSASDFVTGVTIPVDGGYRIR